MDSYNEGGSGGGYEGEEETAMDSEKFGWIGFTSTSALWGVYALLLGSFNAIFAYSWYSVFLQVVKSS